MESLYNVYLAHAPYVAWAYFILGSLALFIPQVFWVVYTRAARYGNDGLPIGKKWGYFFVLLCLMTIIGIVVAIVALFRGLPIAIAPELWAAEMSLSCGR